MYRYYRNPRRLSAAAELKATPARDQLAHWQEAVREIHSWPEYAAQPLHRLTYTAAKVGVGNLFYKDESRRFGPELGSFKALGAPYAVFCLLADRIEAITGTRPTAARMRSGEFHSITRRVTVCVATDGNQGRGLAYGAQVFGCRCVTYIHSHVSEGRKEAMEALGAIVIRIDGEYEDSVRRAREDARLNGCTL